MPFTVARYPDATAFLAATEPFLMEREALNSMILGVARAQQRLQDAPRARRRRPPLFVAVHGPAGPVLAGLGSAARKFLLAAAGSEPNDAALTALVRDLCARASDVPSVFGEAALAQRFAELYGAAAGRAYELKVHQRLHELTNAVLPAAEPPGRLRPATVRESELLADWLLAFQIEAMPHEAGDREAAAIIIDRLLAHKDIFVWETDAGEPPRPVAMAARARPTSRGIAINLVYTPPAERRQGYATALVAHLSRLLLDSGWQFCTLFTDQSNATANRVYARIGYRPIADFVEYRFLPQSTG